MSDEEDIIDRLGRYFQCLVDVNEEVAEVTEAIKNGDKIIKSEHITSTELNEVVQKMKRS